MTFREWFLANESAYTESEALKILGSQELLNQIMPIDTSTGKKYLPAIAVFYKSHQDLANLKTYFEKYEKLGNKVKPIQVKNNMVYYQNTPIDWIKFTEIIDGLVNLQKPKKSTNEQPIDATPIYSHNGINIYESNSPQACIKYGQGYSFCISKPGNTMWQSYRNNKTSTFYFVFDKNRNNSDPLHIVVVDANKNGIELTDANNTTGTIAEYGEDTDAYLEYLKSKGVNISIFQSHPKTEKEMDEQRKLGRAKPDLNWFRNLPYEDKSNYVGRGHLLTDDQFDLLWDNNATDLLSQYARTGQKFSKYQIGKITSNKQLARSFFIARIQANEHDQNLDVEEYELMPQEFKDKIQNIEGIFEDAAELGKINTVKELLPKATKENVYYGLKRAALNGHKNIVELLMSNVDPKEFGTAVHGALIAAARQGYLDIVKLLTPETPNEGTYNRALEAATKTEHIDVIQYLLSQFDNIKEKMAKPPSSNIALDTAVRENSIDIAQMLLPYAQPSGIAIALHTAVEHYDIKMIKLLLTKARNVSAALTAAYSLNPDSEAAHEIIKILKTWMLEQK
jgi:Ankyrin repeats (3 copies)